tara:strand:+ start:162 stop:437 length:276 start_codon:yes stop_codon:yes gene_type:complete
MANINDHHNQTFARRGTKFLSAAALPTVDAGTYVAVQFITDCTPVYLTTHFETGVAYGGIKYLAGTIIYIDVASIRLNSGEVAILYKRVPC